MARPVANVAGTTTVSESGTEIGKLVPHDGAARFDDPTGAVLAYLRPHVGHKASEPWRHPILTPHGQSLGTLTLFPTSSAAELREYLDRIVDQVILDLDINYTTLRLPALGSVLDLQEPVAGRLGDLLAGTLVAGCREDGNRDVLGAKRFGIGRTEGPGGQPGHFVAPFTATLSRSGPKSHGHFVAQSYS